MKRIITVLIVLLILLTGCGNSNQEVNNEKYKNAETLDNFSGILFDNGGYEYELNKVLMTEEGLIFDLILNENCPSIAYYTFDGFIINDKSIDFSECEIEGETTNNIHHHYVIVTKDMLENNGISSVEYINFQFNYDDMSGYIYEYSSQSELAQTYKKQALMSWEYLKNRGYNVLTDKFVTDIDYDNISTMFTLDSYYSLDYDHILVTKDGKFYKSSLGLRSTTNQSTEFYKDLGNYVIFNKEICRKKSDYARSINVYHDNIGYTSISNYLEDNIAYYPIMPDFEYYDKSDAFYYGGNLKYASISEDGKIYSYNTIVDREYFQGEIYEYHFENKELLYEFKDETIKMISGYEGYNYLGFRQDFRHINVLTDKGYYYQTVTSKFVESEYADIDSKYVYEVNLVKDEFLSSIVDEIAFIFEDNVVFKNGIVINNNIRNNLQY